MAAPMRLSIHRFVHLSVRRFTSTGMFLRKICAANKGGSHLPISFPFCRQAGVNNCANTKLSCVFMLSTDCCMHGVHASDKQCGHGHRPLHSLPKVTFAVFVRRWMTTGLTDDMLRKEMEKLTDRFMEAKELLDDARESMGSVYFNEDLQDADEAVKETLIDYKHLLSRLDNAQKQTVTRSIGLKMEELSAQQMMIRESLKD